MSNLRHHITALSTVVLALIFGASGPLRAQTISDIAKSDPLIITGAVGTTNTYHYTSVGDGYASPLNNSLYANLNVSLYGFSMPFSLSYTNSNLQFNYPHFSFHVSPTYRGWTAHLGRSSMEFSPYVLGMSWNGVGLEYNLHNVRAGVFYGNLRTAINPDPSDPFARNPQYRRIGWGAKVGYGNSRNYLDLYVLRAYDSSNSIDEKWWDRVDPQENVVVGVKGAVTPTSWLSFTANAAGSLFSTNTRVRDIPVETRFDKVFDTKYSSLARFAGDASMNLSFPRFNVSANYRLVQPDYTSLGCYYMSNNYHSLGVTMGTTLFRRLALSATFNGQADNLTKQQMYTTRGFVYNANASTRLFNGLNLAFSYNGYLQTQGDGLEVVKDSTEIRRVMSSYSIMPSYTYDTDLFGHNIVLSGNFTTNRDLNRFSTGETDVKTQALGLTYSMEVKPWGVSFTGSASHQQSKGYRQKYSSDVATLGTSRSFLADNNLNVSASVSLCYNEIERQSKSLSIGWDVGAHYTLKDDHIFSLNAGFNKYGDVNMSKVESHLDCTDITVSFSYTYNFTLVRIKRKASTPALP